MYKIKTSKIISFIMITLFLISYMSLLPSTTAYQLGNYYICDFSPYADNTIYVDEKINGVSWLNCSGTYVSTSNYSCIKSNQWKNYITHSTGNLDYRTSNIYIIYQTTNFDIKTIKLDCGSSGSSYAYSTINFYTYSGTLMFYILNTDSASNRNCYLKNAGGSTIATIYTAKSPEQTINLNVTLVTSNSSFHITTTTGYATDTWLTGVTGFDYIYRVNIYSSTMLNPSNLAYVILDNIYVDTTAQTYSWELGKESLSTSGNLLGSTNIGYQNFVYTSQNTWEFESHIDSNLGQDIYLNSFAIAIQSTSIFTSVLNIGLHINNYDIGTYDNSYYFVGSPNRYILVWSNINITVSQHFNYELYSTKLSGSPSLDVLFTINDIHQDSFIQFKYSSGTDYLDGSYNGQITDNDDLLTKIWYTLLSSGCEENVFDGLSYFGAIDIPLSSPIDGFPIRLVQGTNAEIETLYRQPFHNASAKGFDFYVNVGQYSLSPSVSDYVLNINGYSFSPCSFEWYGGSTYRLRFSFSIPVYLNDQTIIELQSLASTSGGIYWFYPVTNNDIDNDGTVQHKYGGAMNGIYDGTTYYSQEWWGGQNYYDMYYRCYYDNLSFGETSCNNPVTAITAEKTTYTLGEAVHFYYNISSNQYQNILYIYEDSNGSIGIEQGYPKNLGGCEGFSSYSPLKASVYYAVINRSGANVSNIFTFTVLPPNDPNHILIPYPEPSFVGDKFNIYYEYKNNGGQTGIIRHGYVLTDNTRFIIDNTTGTITDITGTQYGYYYIKMFTETSPSVYAEVQSITHSVIFVDDTNAKLTLGLDHITLTKEQPTYDQQIQGYMGSIGLTGYISINNVLKYTISSNKVFGIFNYTVSKVGLYYVSLYISTPNGTKELANITFDAVYEETTGDITDAVGEIPLLYKLIIGFLIIIGMISIPLIAAIKANAEIPTFVYLIFATVGLTIDVVLFRDIFLPILISVIAIMCFAIIIMWLRGRSE